MLEWLLIGLAAAAAAPNLDWLAGNWIACNGASLTEERWLGPANGVLVGVNLSRSPANSSFEFFRIAADADGTLAYHAQPGGRPAITFRLAEAKTGKVVFENLQHDFPQRIIYSRAGQTLHARVEATVDGKLEGEQWRFVSGDASLWRG